LVEIEVFAIMAIEIVAGNYYRCIARQKEDKTLYGGLPHN
jgi:hypothetical protein